MENLPAYCAALLFLRSRAYARQGQLVLADQDRAAAMRLLDDDALIRDL